MGMPDATPTIDPDLQALLDKAARLAKRLKFRQQTDKTLQARLAGYRAAIALRVPATAAGEITNTASGGKSYTLAAAGGATVRVTVPAAKLIGRFSGELVATLKNLCGRKFAALFVTHYTCAPNFRQLAHEVLADKETAKEVIALCEEAAPTTVTIS